MKRMTVEDLLASSYDLTAPFELELALQGDTRRVVCADLLRWLPGRRLVARISAHPDAQPTETQVLKLFIGKGARRYQHRERQGLDWLHAAEQRVPAVLEAPVLSGDAAGLLLTYLDGAAPVAADDSKAIAEVARRLASLHEQGIWHEDAKLENFLQQGEEIWFVDGDAIRRQGSPLELRVALANLALLLAERPPQFDAELEDLLGQYCRSRNWSCGDRQVRFFRRALRQARHRRLKRYLRKTLRECSEFAPVQSPRLSGIAVRELAPEIWQPLLADPDTVIAQSELIKAGKSATVVRWQPAAGVSVIVKRYNVKSPLHALRRTLRPLPRYRRAWQFGHALTLSGIATARPLLLLEQQGRWLRGVAWLVMEDLGDSALDPAVTQSEDLLAALVELLQSLRRLGIAHGDAKASNFLLRGDRWHLIDLDAMSLSKNGWRSDASRFLRNFTGVGSAVAERLLSASQP
jgi:tRNA A-37 threonylcarbamoyl transferase component Bud32